MNRSPFSLAALLLPCAALAALLFACAIAVLAAPAPEPFVSGWGNPVDPDKDYKTRREKGVLTIEMPGTDHDYDPHRDRFNAPRLLRDFEGNFDIQVRIQILSRPSAQSTVKGQPSFVSAGFLIIPPHQTFHTACLRLEYGISREGFGFVARKDRHGKKGGIEALRDHRSRNWPLPKESDHAYVRLERRGKSCSCSISPDGKEWTSLMGMGSLPENLKVGLAAYSTSSEPSKVQFDQLKLTRGQRQEPLLFGPLNYQARRP